MKKKYSNILFWTVISVVVLLLVSVRTSPIYSFNYGDYSGNRLSDALIVGKYWFKGCIPYKDYFIMAGPLYLFIEGLSWIIGQRIVLLLVQIISLSVTLCFGYKICTMYLDNKKAIICNLCMLIPFVSLISGGSSSYELCLPFIMIGIYLTLQENKDTKTYCILGLLTGLVLCIDLKASALLLAALVYVIIRDKKAVIVLAVMLVPVVLCIGYFALNGALADMMNGAFIYPLRSFILGLNGINDMIHKCVKCIMLLPLVIAVWLSYKEKNEYTLFYILAVIFTGIALVCGENEWYYYLSLVPAVPLGLSIILSHDYKPVILAGTAFVVVCGICISPLKSYASYVLEGPNEAYTEFNDTLVTYLQDSQDTPSIFILDTDMTFFLENDYQPITKYCCNATNLSEYDSKILDNVNEELSKEGYDLLVIQERGYEGKDLEHYAATSIYLRYGGSIFVYIPVTR